MIISEQKLQARWEIIFQNKEYFILRCENFTRIFCYLKVDFFDELDIILVKNSNILRVETRKSCAGYGTG